MKSHLILPVRALNLEEPITFTPHNVILEGIKAAEELIRKGYGVEVRWIDKGAQNGVEMIFSVDALSQCKVSISSIVLKH